MRLKPSAESFWSKLNLKMAINLKPETVSQAVAAS
jgi:hypothetical protein